MSMRYRERGITLIELLVGMAIAAIVLLPLTDMLRVGADSARFVRANLDQNADARLAADRITARIAAQASSTNGPKPGTPPVGDPAAWLAPWQYKLANGALTETDPSPKSARTSVLATGVRSFALTVPEIGAGYPVLRIDLVLDRPDCQATGAACLVSYARTVRLGALR